MTSLVYIMELKDRMFHIHRLLSDDVIPFRKGKAIVRISATHTSDFEKGIKVDVSITEIYKRLYASKETFTREELEIVFRNVVDSILVERNIITEPSKSHVVMIYLSVDEVVTIEYTYLRGS